MLWLRGLSRELVSRFDLPKRLRAHSTTSKLDDRSNVSLAYKLVSTIVLLELSNFLCSFGRNTCPDRHFFVRRPFIRNWFNERSGPRVASKKIKVVKGITETLNS